MVDPPALEAAADDLDDAPRAPSLLLSWLRLLRAPNVFTAIANAVAAFVFVHGAEGCAKHPATLALLVVASTLLYLAGMVLNDVADVEVDREERAFRPLPSGAISLSTATRVGWTLVALGWISATVAGQTFATPSWRPALVGGLLAGMIAAYNFVLKHGPLGPLAMGECRMLNWLLGMSLGPALVNVGDRLIRPASIGVSDSLRLTLPSEAFGYPIDCWLAASAIGLFIVGVTTFSRGEAETSRRRLLVLGLVAMIAAMALVAAMPQVRAASPRMRDLFPWMILLVAGPIVLRATRAILDPSPQNVQKTVRSALMSLIVWDAALCLAAGEPMASLAVLTLLAPMLLLAKWVYST